MDADWSVELGADDATLEFPWSSPDGSQRYIDLRRHPEQLPEIPEATRFPEIAEFLRAINQPQSSCLTAKCDVWLGEEIGEAETIYEASIKLCSYVDLVACDKAARLSFDRHERWARSAAHALSSDDALPVACEFIVRRCWFHRDAATESDAVDALTSEDEPSIPGFYVTLYMSGYGNDESAARAAWAEGLRRVTGVLIALVP
jgi:hypothetical protein